MMHAAIEQVKPPTSMGQEPNPKKRFSVLMVDDQPLWAAGLSKELSDTFDFVSVSHLHALEPILSSRRHFDVVVLDYMFSESRNDSGSDGIDLINTIKQSLPDVPLVAFSAFTDDVGAQLKLENQVVETFPKSSALSTDKLRETLLKAIAGSKGKKFQSVRKTSVEEATSNLIRSVIADEIARLSPLRERTLSIPGEGNFELIAPLIGYRRKIEERIARFPFSKNVFLMMKFRANNEDLSNYILETLSGHGLRGVRADQDEWNLTNNAFNPIAALYCCKYGIALFDEPEEGLSYSPNVAYELGMMHCQKKETLILRHHSLPQVPFDLVKDLYVTYERDLQVRQFISKWVSQVPQNNTATG